MEKTLADLAALVHGEVDGDPDFPVSGVCSAERGHANRVAYVESPKALPTDAGALVVNRELQVPGKPLIRVDHPKIAFLTLLALFHPEERPAPGIHPTAVVNESASLGGEVHVGPHAVIEAGAVIGDRTVIGAGSVVGAGVRIGAESRLFPRVVIYAGVTLGERVRVHAGTVLGSDGFGYVDTPEGKLKFPQVGTLTIADDVEIGALTAIDRGALDATTIGVGTKIDNLCQIAHNVEIGRHCAISGQTGIAGTAKIGDWCVFGGSVGIADHAEIQDRVQLGAMAGVPSGKPLSAGGYWGAPCMPIREALRVVAARRKLPGLVKTVGKLEKRIEALEKEEA